MRPLRPVAGLAGLGLFLLPPGCCWLMGAAWCHGGSDSEKVNLMSAENAMLRAELAFSVANSQAELPAGTASGEETLQRRHTYHSGGTEAEVRARFADAGPPVMDVSDSMRWKSAAQLQTEYSTKLEAELKSSREKVQTLMDRLHSVESGERVALFVDLSGWLAGSLARCHCLSGALTLSVQLVAALIDHSIRVRCCCPPCAPQRMRAAFGRLCSSTGKQWWRHQLPPHVQQPLRVPRAVQRASSA